MPYAGFGIYTGPSGSTNATPGQVIRSATWDTINTDYASALTLVGAQLWGTITTKTANYTVSNTDSALIFNGSATVTVTLPAASVIPGNWLYVKTIAAQAVISASSNVAPLTASSAGTAILAATIGKWAALKSDGANWIVMMAN